MSARTLWTDGVDGSAVYVKPTGKAPLYLFKRGVSWRVGRKPGNQNAIAVLQEGQTLLTEGAAWSLYDGKTKGWKSETGTVGTCVDAALKE